MNCKLSTIILIGIIVYLCIRLKTKKESFNITTLPGPNNMVLTDELGNLSSINFPKGIIVMWQGTENNVPSGWALCDGSKGTPDLRGRFVLGLNPNSNPNNLTKNTTGQTGGTEKHKLTVDEMPAHGHPMGGDISSDMSGSRYGGNTNRRRDGQWTGVIGGNQPHENMPPYLVLAYIMRL